MYNKSVRFSIDDKHRQGGRRQMYDGTPQEWWMILLTSGPSAIN